jgi:hypothetical protein
MLSTPIRAKVIFALALAILMAWAGHAPALFTGSSQSAWSGNDEAHAHGGGAFTCTACADHYHSSLAADHVHETPHLPALLSIGTLSVRAVPIEAPRYSISLGPIFLIERPPRSLLAI